MESIRRYGLEKTLQIGDALDADRIRVRYLALVSESQMYASIADKAKSILLFYLDSEAKKVFDSAVENDPQSELEKRRKWNTMCYLRKKINSNDKRRLFDIESECEEKFDDAYNKVENIAKQYLGRVKK